MLEGRERRLFITTVDHGSELRIPPSISGRRRIHASLNFRYRDDGRARAGNVGNWVYGVGISIIGIIGPGWDGMGKGGLMEG